MIITGSIKWYDPQRLFGFIVPDGDGDDILIHSNVLHDYGVSSIIEGTKIKCKIIETGRGVQVQKIIALEFPKNDPIHILKSFVTDHELLKEKLKTAPLLPSRVKWYDHAKGFGFINAFGDPSDIFIHIELMRAYGFAVLERGEAVAIKKMEGIRGNVVIELKHWDSHS